MAASSSISKSKRSRPSDARRAPQAQDVPPDVLTAFETIKRAAAEQAKVYDAEHAARERRERSTPPPTGPCTRIEIARLDAAREAARKVQILADALVSLAECAEDEFEDIETAIAVVLSVARRQSDLAFVLVGALDAPKSYLGNTTPEIVSRASNG
jgi:hypothetical protein